LIVLQKQRFFHIDKLFTSGFTSQHCAIR
jgi:hypothetical protein